MKDFRVGTVSISPEIAFADDRRIVFRVPMERLISSGIVSKDIEEPFHLPVAFSFSDNSFWSWLSSSERPFVTTVVVMPMIIGEIRAVYSASRPTQERREQCRGPFVSPRVRTRLTWTGVRVGERYDVWSASPSEGWRIDLDTIDYQFRFLFRNCWSGRGGASWVEQTEQMIRVRAHTIAEATPTMTCMTETTICFTERRAAVSTEETVTEYQTLFADRTSILQLQGSHSGARLMHLEASSAMFEGGSKIFRVDDPSTGITADYDQATQAVYVKIGYER